MSQLESMNRCRSNSQMLRLCLIVGLALVLLIPIVMIWGLVSEAQDRNRKRRQSLFEVGNTQTIIGPALILRTRLAGWRRLPLVRSRAQASEMRFSCRNSCETTGRIDVESASRGIFKVRFMFDSFTGGEFGKPNLAELESIRQASPGIAPSHGRYFRCARHSGTICSFME